MTTEDQALAERAYRNRVTALRSAIERREDAGEAVKLARSALTKTKKLAHEHDVDTDAIDAETDGD